MVQMTSANNFITYDTNGFGMLESLCSSSQVQRFFTNKGIITLNQAYWQNNDYRHIDLQPDSQTIVRYILS